MDRSLKIGFIFSITVVFLVACSTEKNTLINRSYHGLTAHYNGYFNATELIRQSMDTYQDSRTENYYELIPIDPVPNEDEVIGMYPAIDTAIAKCKKVIQKHSMPSNDRPHLKKDEHNKWIDENWTTIGIASYLRRDYTGAMKSFKYVRKFYSNDPSLYIGELWMAKTNIATGKLTDAKFNLDNLDKAIVNEEENKPGVFGAVKNVFADKKKKEEKVAKFPKKIRADFERTKAEFALVKENKEDAIKFLEESLKHKQTTRQKARTHFVLGQLYEDQGDDNRAIYHYTKVLKGNAKYEMAFNARIKRAFLGSGEEKKKELNKMLKDAKNAEYKDQIYYALAGMELKENNEPKAVEYLTLSAFYSDKNKRQKGMAYEKMGDLRFQKRDYIRAQKYYDSCAAVIPEDYPNGDAIRNKAANLASLVMAVETAIYEDSVQRIAAMSENDRTDYLKDVIKKIEEEEKRRKEREAQRLRELQENQNVFVEEVSGAKFYWNNPKSIKDGSAEFKRNWGERVNEDDWRRSEKMPSINIDQDIEEGDSLAQPKKDTLTVAMLEKNLPLTEEQLKESNERLLEAYYNAGVIYLKELDEPKVAKEYFEKVLDKKIENKHNLLAAFQLYKMYETSDPSASAKYRDYILENYPESDYANYLKDPDYFIKKKERDALAEQEYVTVLDRYDRGLYYPVITKANKVIDGEKENIFRSKYMLLKALALGQVTEDKNELIPVLEGVLIEYPDTPEAAKAQEMLNIIKNGYSKNEPFDFDKKEDFTYDDRAKLKVIVIIEGQETSNSAKIKIVDFNREFFSRERINVNSSAYNNSQSIIILSDFETESDASEYIRVYRRTRKHLMDLQNAKIMMITDANLKVVIQKQKLTDYEKFYEEYY